MISGWSYAAYATFLQIRDTYLVLIPNEADVPEGLLLGDGSGIGYGADNVSFSSDRVFVDFPHGMSQAEQDALVRRLSQVMPKGSRIVRCYGQRC